MSVNFNSQYTPNNNIIPARKLSGKKSDADIILAPQSLPKFSVTKALQDKQDFRDTVIYNSYRQNLKNNKQHKFLFIGVFAAAVLLISKLLKR